MDSKNKDSFMKHFYSVSSPINGFDNGQLRGNTCHSDGLEVSSEKGTENIFVDKNNLHSSCDSVECFQQDDQHQPPVADVESGDIVKATVKRGTDVVFHTSEPVCDNDKCHTKHQCVLDSITNSSSDGQDETCENYHFEGVQNSKFNSTKNCCSKPFIRTADNDSHDGSQEGLSDEEQSYKDKSSSHPEIGPDKVECHTADKEVFNQKSDTLSCVETGEETCGQKDDTSCQVVKAKSDQEEEKSQNSNMGIKVTLDAETSAPVCEDIKCESGKPNRNVESNKVIMNDVNIPDCVGPTLRNVEHCLEVKPGKEIPSNQCEDSYGVRVLKDLDVAKQVNKNIDYTSRTPLIQNSSQFINHVIHGSKKICLDTCDLGINAYNMSNITQEICFSRQKLKTGETNDSLPHIPELMKSGLLKDLTISVVPSEKKKDSLKSTPVKLLQDNPLPPFLESICGNTVTDEMVENILREAGFPDFFQGEVTIGKFIPVKFPDNYNFRLHEDEMLLECPSMVTPLLMKKKDVFPPKVTLQNGDDDVKTNCGGEKVEDATVRHIKTESSKDLLKFSMGSEKFEKKEEGFKDKSKESLKTTVNTEEIKEAEKISVRTEEKVEGRKMNATRLPATLVADNENRKVITEKNENDSNKRKESSPQTNCDVQENRKEYLTNTAIGYLTALGLSRVQEWHRKDLMKSKERHIRRAGKTKQLEQELAVIEAAYLQAKKANEPFVFKSHKCSFCNFKSESVIVMDDHNSVPYMTPRKEFGCHLCEFCTRNPAAILYHMETEHKKMGQLPVPSQFHECPFCPFDTNHKQKLNSHINRCQKFFVLGKNQSTELDIPAQTVKPITIMDIKAYMYERQLIELATATRRPGHPPGSRGGHRINVPRPQANISRPFIPSDMLQYNRPLYQHLADGVPLHSRMPVSSYSRSTGVVAINRIPQTARSALFRSSSHAVPTNHIYHVVGSRNTVPIFSSNGQTSCCRSVSQTSNASASAPQPVALFTNVAVSASGTSVSTVNKESLLKTELSPPPKLQGPFLSGSRKSATGETILPSNSFVICEICDGYIKDQEELRSHMQIIHKVKIHPKMLQNRPPLNCQKCQWRFFTDQGLERHLLGSHGLVTSNMQDLAQRSQDGGRCTICGRVYVCKLVAHMNQVHKIMLKPAHLSYKCTVCTATFNLYKLFENHVYVVHSGSVKRRAEDDSSDQPPKKRTGVRSTKTTTSRANPRLKSKKATPPVRTGAGNGKSKVSAVTGEERVPDRNSGKQKCGDCGIEVGDFFNHIKEKHIKNCSIQACRIEQCQKCQGSFDGLGVYTSDNRLSEESPKKEGARGVKNGRVKSRDSM